MSVEGLTLTRNLNPLSVALIETNPRGRADVGKYLHG